MRLSAEGMIKHLCFFLFGGCRRGILSKRHFPLISTVLERGEERRVSVCEREKEREGESKSTSSQSHMTAEFPWRQQQCNSEMLACSVEGRLGIWQQQQLDVFCQPDRCFLSSQR